MKIKKSFFKQNSCSTDPFLKNYNYLPTQQIPLTNIQKMIENLDTELAELYRTETINLPTPRRLSISINRPVNIVTLGRSTPTPTITRSMDELLKTKPATIKTVSLGTSENHFPHPSFTITPPIANNDKVFNYERYKIYRHKAIRAAQNQKIFTIHGGYTRIRQSLIKRGWVEKCSPNYLRNIQAMSNHSIMRNTRPGNDYEIVAMSKIIQRYPPNFIWQPKGLRDSHTYVFPYRNRIRRGRALDFTTKEGLIGCIETSHWNTVDNMSEIQAPRFHRLGAEEEHPEFLRDYRTTFCLSLLMFISEEHEPEKLFDESGCVSISMIVFAMDRIRAEIVCKQHGDLNSSSECRLINDDTDDSNGTWDSFYSSVTRISKRMGKFRLVNEIDITNYIFDTKRLITEAKNYWPRMHADGYHNIWIMKPAFSSRGNGIMLKKSYNDIIMLASKRMKMRYIVQKYIERPLLIYKTKFDIRQYTLLTITDNKFNIWMYKDCYVRFSSQEYQLNELRESIHITNNAIQKKYKNGARSDKLPTHNMWSLVQFQSYLIDHNNANVWSKIYGGMKKNIIAVVLASLEDTEIITNSFEMYGCDFMLDQNYDPILIEINSTPDMSSSTVVTAKICPQALDDLIKVVVDVPRDVNARTGQFELIYSVSYQKPGALSNVGGLEVSGKCMRILPLTQAIVSEPPIKTPDRLRAGRNKIMKKKRTIKLKPKPKAITNETDQLSARFKKVNNDDNRLTLVKKSPYESKLQTSQKQLTNIPKINNTKIQVNTALTNVSFLKTHKKCVKRAVAVAAAAAAAATVANPKTTTSNNNTNHNHNYNHSNGNNSNGNNVGSSTASKVFKTDRDRSTSALKIIRKSLDKIKELEDTKKKPIRPKKESHDKSTQKGKQRLFPGRERNVLSSNEKQALILKSNKPNILIQDEQILGSFLDIFYKKIWN